MIKYELTRYLKKRLYKGEVAISWLDSYSSIVMRATSSSVIFDPVTETHLKRNTILLPDAIIITHEHSDHFNPYLLKYYNNESVPVYANSYIASELSKDIKVVNIGDILPFKSLNVVVERSKHPGKDPFAFIITVPNGPTIYHPSDSDPYPEMDQLENIYKPDIMIYSGTSAKIARNIAQLVKPRLIISPYCDSIWARAFNEEIRSIMAQLVLVKPFEEYVFSMSATAEGLKID